MGHLLLRADRIQRFFNMIFDQHKTGRTGGLDSLEPATCFYADIYTLARSPLSLSLYPLLVILFITIIDYVEESQLVDTLGS